MLIVYAFCAIPFLMLGIVCFALVGKVREGRYSKAMLGKPPVEFHPPSTAVKLVMVPAVAVILSALAQRAIGGLAAAGLLVGAAIVGRLVYVAAAKRHSGTRTVG